jgi:hypothetical protein
MIDISGFVSKIGDSIPTPDKGATTPKLASLRLGLVYV